MFEVIYINIKADLAHSSFAGWHMLFLALATAQSNMKSCAVPTDAPGSNEDVL